MTRLDLPTLGRPTTATTGSGPWAAPPSETGPWASSSAWSSGLRLEVVEPGAQGALHGGVVDGGVGGRDRNALVDGAGGLVSHGVLESVNVC